VPITNPTIFRGRLKNDSMRCGKLPRLRFSGLPMQNRDFRDLFAEFYAAGVEYLLVGPHALVHFIRFTSLQSGNAAHGCCRLRAQPPMTTIESIATRSERMHLFTILNRRSSPAACSLLAE
jgi:hypothetical protein